MAIVNNCRLPGAVDRVNSACIHAASLFELILVFSIDILPFFFFMRSSLGLTATLFVEPSLPALPLLVPFAGWL